MADDVQQDVVSRFRQLYSDSRERTWGNTRWLGTHTLKIPLDLWVYQEILFECRPDVIVETGTSRGGSALYLASICDLLDSGRVITIDLRLPRPGITRPSHPRIEYLTGSSVAPEIVQRVRESVAGKRGMVILDSNHSKSHVLNELRTYAPLVGIGQYLIVEDTAINDGHPVRPDVGPGPMEAVEEFLSETDAYEIDHDCEKFFLTSNPGGFLRRLS